MMVEFPFFVGRQEELQVIGETIAEAGKRQAVLIHGPGGIGKTRLAIQAAAERIESFSHGVFFVPLDPLSSADFLVSTIAEALRFTFYSKEDEKVQLLNYLREKKLLLIYLQVVLPSQLSFMLIQSNLFNLVRKNRMKILSFKIFICSL